ncbi:hypothetical protein [Bacillus oleivorans]|uniref:hypothetical protein n=1 Tax=Bacillus oleivorans TaxID=1448271 RepID=UPI000BE39F16|nr:hypothetical protein [Bacillus oleivorans]
MRQVLSVVMGVMMLVFLAACQLEADDGTEVEEIEHRGEENHSEDVETANNNDQTMIKAKKIESYPASLYEQTGFDIDQDGEDEQIELYVNAHKDEDGEFAWDDGHNWLFVVKDGNETYPLYDGWVQLGSLSFWLIESNETPMIILLKTGTAEFTLQTFRFSEEEKGFIQETQFNPEKVNFWYHSK